MKRCFLKFIRLNRETKPLILYPTYVSVILFLGFILLAFSKGLFLKDINEIGDSLAGFSGVLAFLWLIVTVLLQNRDLNLQYNEIKEMRAASESQAQSLESSQIFQTLEYIEVKLANISEFSIERRDIIIAELLQFKDENGTRFEGKVHVDLAEVVGYFFNKGASLEFELSNIRNDFTYQSYLRVQAIEMNIHDIVSTYDTLMLNVPDKIKGTVQEYINVHKKQLGIGWCDHRMHYYYKSLSTTLMRAILEYGKGSENNRLWIEALLEMENKENKEQND